MINVATGIREHPTGVGVPQGGEPVFAARRRLFLGFRGSYEEMSGWLLILTAAELMDGLASYSGRELPLSEATERGCTAS